MVRTRKRDESYPREWDDEAADAFTASDLLVLSDDGEQALFVPLTSPKPVTEQAFGATRERMHIGVARVGDTEIGTPDTWHVQDWPVGVRLFRRYRMLRSRTVGADAFEGAKILRLVREGEAGNQKTAYHLDVVQDVTPDAADVVKALTEEAFAS